MNYFDFVVIMLYWRVDCEMHCASGESRAMDSTWVGCACAKARDVRAIVLFCILECALDTLAK